MPEMHHYAAHDGPSIKVTERDDRTMLMSVLMHLVRLFRKQLNASEPNHEDGSIRLNPPKTRLKPCIASHRTVCDIHIYDIIPPKQPTKTPSKRIYYIAGGSWQLAPSGQHWWVCAKLAQVLPDTIISIISVPLAPNNTASSSFPWCLRLYRELMRTAEHAGERVTFMGDSSGANIVLCLVMEALRQEAENPEMEQTPRPISLMVISPSTDMTRNNPDIQNLRKFDPLLSPEIIKATAKAWHADDVDPTDRIVSPINADFSLLAKSGIRVHGVTAGYDVLSPDGIVFRNRLSEYGIQGEWLHWEKQMHCFVLTAPYRLSEGKQGLDWVFDVIKRDGI
ncbi:alpha/beta-hydrolase [Macroventuria anomochaeta]|uniref:Alpha/beta-hydrolase n=1 Tax=Macroventuria anomochaeta TaxID=301207 RepID=A0ACB6RX86_9PLEO|nr:alpha/beta-hydrolase [Macroventuria anomochaeta]KAF2626338.1 alpha/beta-hydrolase [Macroventuria anomochaeta]